MKEIFSQLYNKYLNTRFSIRVCLFHICVIVGIVLYLIIALINLWAGNEMSVVWISLGTAFFSYILLHYSSHSENHTYYYLAFIGISFFILLPYLFLHMGGYHGSIPTFFVFALVFTAFILRGSTLLIVMALELILYLFLYLYAFNYPANIHGFDSEKAYLSSHIMNLMIVGIAFGATISAQITLYQHRQEKLEEQNTHLRQVNRLKTEFLGNASHEIKTPLTVISIYAQEIRKKLITRPDLAELDRSIKLIVSETDRLALTVSQVLDVTRIDEGHMVCNIEPASISQIIQSILQAYYPIFVKNNNILELTRDSRCLTVLCDPQRISQVLVNLISNASRHTHDGKITIAVKKIDGFAEISVTDTGEGIAPKFLPYLFERFKTAVHHNGSETGTGLGLFICKYIVEQHHGQINLESEEGQGTKVTFTLPLQIEPSETYSACQ